MIMIEASFDCCEGNLVNIAIQEGWEINEYFFVGICKSY